MVGAPIEAAALRGVAVAVTAAEVPIVAADLIAAEEVATEEETTNVHDVESLPGLSSQEGSLFYSPSPNSQ
ncbi:MAG: hypothetical protein ABL905_04095 [Nitrospiraceae bacterium]